MPDPNMPESPQEPQENQGFEEMMFGMTQFTQAIQNEIAIVLIQRPEIKNRVEKLINKPDHEIVECLNKSVRDFIIAMTIAESYGVNILMNVIATHSSVTGNTALSDGMLAVQEKIQQINK